MELVVRVMSVEGTFYAKDLQENVRELKANDNILLNDLVYGSKDNSIDAKLTVVFSGGGAIITLKN